MAENVSRADGAMEGVRACRADDRTRVFRAMGLATPERGGAPWCPDGADGGIAPQTRILTLDGAIPAGELMVGDRLVTRDSGTATLRWVGRVDRESLRVRLEEAAPAGMNELERELALAEAEATLNRPAMRIAPGAFARDVPFGEVVIAPSARVLLRGRTPGAKPGRELLAEACHLAGAMGIEACEPLEAYLTLHLDRPEIVYAEGLEIASGRPLAKSRETRRTATAAEIRAFAA